MAWVTPFYSMSTGMPASMVWHNNNICLTGESIPWEDRITGMGGLPQCPQCARM
jgi:hypothetical protein